MEATSSANDPRAKLYDRLIARLPTEPQYPTQGATVFINLSTRQVRKVYSNRQMVETFLEGRGGNMVYLLNLLDTDLEPLDPYTPLIFASGVLTGHVPSASRGNVTSWSPETGVIMDSNCGDYFPSYMMHNGLQRLILYGDPGEWTWLKYENGEFSFHDAKDLMGLNNIDLREGMADKADGRFPGNLAMVSITEAGEKGCLNAGIMGGPKAIYARGGTGAKMASLKLKAIVIKNFEVDREGVAQPPVYKKGNAVVAKKLLKTSVVKNALKTRGTPFLYKPSRLLGALGTKNNQQGHWVESLDAENIDPYRPGMAGCFACPVNCRPLNDLNKDDQGHGQGDRYDEGDGPEYVTLGKFGPNLGITDVKDVIRLNNICNDLGLDTSSTGSTLSWAFELFERGIISEKDTGGLALNWGDAAMIEKLLFMLSRREGFGDTLAWSSQAVKGAKYPESALTYRMAVKNLFQSDPHDARILKAFALGLAVATRGMDHLRNRVTLEINARINDDPDFKKRLYGQSVSAKPNVYETKEHAVRRCEDSYAVGDSVGMCRFTTFLFNSPSLPGMEEFSTRLKEIADLDLSEEALWQIGLNISGLERLLNHMMGTRRKDDTLPDRWFDEGLQAGPYEGEKIDRQQFDEMLSRFYQVSGLDHEGCPVVDWRATLAKIATSFAVTVKLPGELQATPEGASVVHEAVDSLGDLVKVLDKEYPGLKKELEDKDSVFSFAVNQQMILEKAMTHPIKDGDQVEILQSFSGG